jgi:hypothetical protein
MNYYLNTKLLEASPTLENAEYYNENNKNLFQSKCEIKTINYHLYVNKTPDLQESKVVIDIVPFNNKNSKRRSK